MLKDRAKNDKIKSPQLNLSKGSSIPHEQYSTRNAVSSSPNEICGEIFAEIRDEFMCVTAVFAKV